LLTSIQLNLMPWLAVTDEQLSSVPVRSENMWVCPTRRWYFVQPAASAFTWPPAGPFRICSALSDSP